MAMREKYPRYALMVVMVTASGLVQNEYAMQSVQREVTLEELFR